jgi:nitroreductase
MPQTPFQQLVGKRRSVRKYLDRPVDRDQILACLEAARLAPSAENVQPWRFLVVDDPVLRARFAAEAFSGIYAASRFAAKAPVLILVLARLDILANRLGRQIQGVPFYLIDIGIAGEHLTLQAEELGLGACWIGWFNMRRVRKLLQIPRRFKIVCLLSLGHPEFRLSGEKKRKPIQEIAWFNGVERD